MTKKIFCSLMIISLLMACSKSEPTKSNDDPIVGSWTLSLMRIDDTEWNYAEEDNIPYRLEFYSDGRGNVWMKDYGVITDDSPQSFTWSTSGTTLTINQQGEGSFSMTYSISNDVLTLFMIDGSEIIEFVYNKS